MNQIIVLLTVHQKLLSAMKNTAKIFSMSWGIQVLGHVFFHTRIVVLVS